MLYDENFLGQLQNKYIIIEVWEKINDHEQLIGVTKLSLHRFYVIFRNSEVATHLFKNQVSFSFGEVQYLMVFESVKF